MNNVWDNFYKKDIFLQERLSHHLNAVSFSSGMKILDIGCGNCGHLSLLRRLQGVEPYGIDISLGAISKRTDNLVNACCACATYLPIKDDVFDLVYSFGTIEHTNTELAIRESYRILRVGGLAIHTVPNLYSVWTAQRPIKKLLGRWKIGTERSFSPAKFKSMFEEVGFRDIHWHTAGFKYMPGGLTFITKPLHKFDNFVQRIFRFHGFSLFMSGRK